MPDRSADEERAPTVDRRTVLKASAAATAGTAGMTAATGSATAALFGECESGWADAPQNYPTIDLTRENPETGGDFPAGAGEFVIYVHGWLEFFASGSKDQGYTLEQALEQNGYEHPTVAAFWDSNQPVWSVAKANADEAGARLAAWLDGYLDRYPDTTIRTVDHSLGARVALEALNQLNGSETLANVSLVGAAVDPDSVCEGGEYDSGIENSASEVFNYHSENDDIVCHTYQMREGKPGLGCKGSRCGFFGFGGDTPSNYADVDVTDQVANHCDYGKPDVGCVPTIVSNF